MKQISNGVLKFRETRYINDFSSKEQFLLVELLSSDKDISDRRLIFHINDTDDINLYNRVEKFAIGDELTLCYTDGNLSDITFKKKFK